MKEPRARRAPRPGTARAALAVPSFRVMWLGSLASTIGTWMQNVVLLPFAFRLAGNSATFAGVVGLAQLGPVLLLSVVGGTLAARVSRKRVVAISQSVQLVFAVLLAWLAAGRPPSPARWWDALTQPAARTPSELALVLVVLGGGIANALGAPSWQAVLPTLVGRANLPGAIALSSTSLNVARVIGPVLVAILAGRFGLTPSGIFLINALTFLFVLGAVFAVAVPPTPPPGPDEPQGLRRLGAGFRYARTNAVVTRILTILPIFSFSCLVFVGQFQTIAERAFGVDSTAGTYRWLYATWGLGATLGALSIGTFFADIDTALATRRFLWGFSVSLALFGLVRSAGPAFPAAFALGFCYFGATTSMSTVFHQRLSDRTRGPVVALWFMGFGGTVPLSAMAGGWLMDHWSVRGVLLVGAAVALVLSAFARFDRVGAERPPARGHAST